MNPLVFANTQMKNVIYILVGIFGATMSASSMAADVAAGASVAQSCAMCHGEKGISTMAGTPSLAGQPDLYLASQLRDFRDGKRHNEVMNVIAKPLSDAEIDDVSAYFAQFEIQLKKKGK